MKNDDDTSEEEPKYGPLRRLSQKKEQIFLNYPSAFSLAMILLTLVKLFVQIFDILTDTMISNFCFPFENYYIYFCSIERNLFGRKGELQNSAFRLL